MINESEIDALLDSATELAADTAGEVGSTGTSGNPSAPDRSRRSDASGANDLSRLLRLEMPLMVILAERTMTFREVLQLTAGSIIEFDRSSDSELQLQVGNRTIGQGLAVKVGENFGLHITQIRSVSDRVKAMGGK